MNHASGCLVARLSTLVGLRRVSIGPPIMVMAARRVLAAGGHQRHGGQHRHGRLAHRDHVQFVRADVADELLDVGDVVVQAERALPPAGTMRASTQSVM